MSYDKGNRNWIVTVQPTVEPVTIDELKLFARIDGNSEDTLLTSLIIDARKRAENYTSRVFIEQTIQLSLDNWNERQIKLPNPPLISVSSVETLDEDDAATIYSSDNYYITTDSIPGRLVIKQGSSLPLNTSRDAGGYRITYKAGYGATAADVPEDVKTSIKIWAALVYENRDFEDTIPDKVRKKLYWHRLINV